MLQTQLAALALAAVTFAVGGCGGSSKTDTTTSSAASTTTTPVTTASTAATTTETIKIHPGKALPRTQFIAKGEVICAHLNSELNSTKIKSPQDFARVFPQAAAWERAEFVELSKLTPPASMTSDWKQFLAGTKKWSEESLKIGEVAQTGNLGPSSLAISIKKTHEQLAAIAKRNGFKECAVV